MLLNANRKELSGGCCRTQVNGPLAEPQLVKEKRRFQELKHEVHLKYDVTKEGKT